MLSAARSGGPRNTNYVADTSSSIKRVSYCRDFLSPPLPVATSALSSPLPVTASLHAVISVVARQWIPPKNLSGCLLTSIIVVYQLSSIRTLSLPHLAGGPFPLGTQ